MTESALQGVFGRRSLLGENVQRFVDERISPIVEELDATGRFPEEIYDEMASMGLFGITLPEDQGGGGGSYRDFVELMELVSCGYASIGDQVGLIEIVGHLLATHGTLEQRSAYLSPLLSGRLRCAYALTEPEAGSDLGAIRTRAERRDDQWVLRGEKIFIHNAPVADFALTLAVTDEAAGKRGMSVFIVPTDLPGVSITNKTDKMGQRASLLAGIHFDDVVLGDDALLGEAGRGFHYVMSGLDVGRVGIAAMSLGISRAALIASIQHATSRVQFGKAIGANQAISFPIADMATEYRAAKGLVEDAAELLDSAAPATVACSMAKLFASEACVRHSSTAVQIHGGSGYIRGMEPERLYRDARITMIFEGASEIQRLVIGRSLLG